MPKYLVPVSLTKLGYAEIEGDDLDDALAYCYPDSDDIIGERDSEEGWYYDASEACKVYDEKIGDYVDMEED